MYIAIYIHHRHEIPAIIIHQASYRIHFIVAIQELETINETHWLSFLINWKLYLLFMQSCNRLLIKRQKKE